MNPQAAWRDLWLVLTLLTLLLVLTSSSLLVAGLLQDPAYILAILTRPDTLLRWPPQPDMEQLTVLAPPPLAVLAWCFHRFYQDSLAPLPPAHNRTPFPDR